MGGIPRYGGYTDVWALPRCGYTPHMGGIPRGYTPPYIGVCPHPGACALMWGYTRILRYSPVWGVDHHMGSIPRYEGIRYGGYIRIWGYTAHIVGIHFMGGIPPSVGCTPSWAYALIWGNFPIIGGCPLYEYCAQIVPLRGKRNNKQSNVCF